MVCPECGTEHSPSARCQRIQQVALSLNFFGVPAFLTDPFNRIVGVNETFASMIGDPIQDRLPSSLRFVDAAIIGPYRERFPRGMQEVAQCAMGLMAEVEAGRLAPGAVRLLEATLALHEDLARKALESNTHWDGTVVVKDLQSKMSLVREQVVPVSGPRGRNCAFHVSWWLPAEKDPPESLAALSDKPTEVSAVLSVRQLEIARWYAAGLNSRAVAEKARITVKTARDHLEEIYSRLDIHSRAELAALLVREGLL